MEDTSPRSNVASPAGTNASGRKTADKADTSRMSGAVAVASARTTSSRASELSISHTPQGNPFKMPADNDIFLLRDKEKQRKKQERLKQRNLKVHEKTTYTSKINFRTAGMIHADDSDNEKDKEDDDGARTVAVKEDPQWTLAVTRDRRIEKESLADYINKKRDMFLVQYSLGVKRDEMRKLEEIALAEEKKLELAEQYLEEDAAMFDEFLKENDKNSVEAIKIAEAETKAKLEKVAEIKRINAQMMALKSEISKYEDTLKEYLHYKKFLDSLTPQEWQDEKTAARLKRREERRKRREAEKAESSKAGSIEAEKSSSSLVPRGKKTPKQGSKQKAITAGGTSDGRSDESSDDSDQEPELFFSHPQQLLDIFADLEEQNLALIQNSQETEEALEEMKVQIKQTKDKKEKETSILKEQINKLKTAIAKEEDKSADLEMKARMFSFGEFKSEDQEKMLEELNKKVEDVYRSTIGDNEANIDTLQMLTNIENRLEELFEMIEMMPPEKVEAAEKAKEKERRLKLREEKMEQQRIHQEERIRRALERAKADPKKKTGKKLVYRSEPLRRKKKEDDGADQASKDEEEYNFYFTFQ